MPPFRKIYLEELTRIQDRINSLFEQALVGVHHLEIFGRFTSNQQDFGHLATSPRASVFHSHHAHG